MNIESKIDRLVTRFCLWLGRYGGWSKFLDDIASLIWPSFVNPVLLPGAVGQLIPLAGPLFMAGVSSGPEGTRLPSPTPSGGDPGDPPHSTNECAPLIYHGMHGSPCAYNGGTSDNKMCPAGTISGLWWRYNVPTIGFVYYVDCCGMPVQWKVWCRWAKEQNWCVGRGNNVYTCTLTILPTELHKDADGFADPQFYVLVGPPAPPSPPPAPPPAPGPPTATIYTVVRGDSLSKIAKKFYGNANLWHKIYAANKAVIGSNPNLILPGQKLTIP
jgi:hypothetical protein